MEQKVGNQQREGADVVWGRSDCLHLSKQSRETETLKPGSPTTWTSLARPSAARQRIRGLLLSSAADSRDSEGAWTSSGPRDPRAEPWCWKRRTAVRVYPSMKLELKDQKKDEEIYFSFLQVATN